MRTIKFRGRHLCGQWYYGNLIVRETDSPVPETPQAYKCVMIGDVDDGSAEEVEEETVGQFVGLCDWKGREIYEGDVIEGNYNFRHVVRFKKTAASFVACLIPETKFSPNCAFDKKWIDEFGKEVIGNIHDNPELLRGE